MELQLNLLSNPLTWLAVLAVAMICALVLFVSLKCEIAGARRLARQTAASADQLRVSLEAELAAIRETPPVVQEVVVAAPVVGEGLNLTRRAAALRMEKRGESVSTIAAALRVPQNEIELLLKLQKLAGQIENQPV
jgi:hypothetical protein